MIPGRRAGKRDASTTATPAATGAPHQSPESADKQRITRTTRSIGIAVGLATAIVTIIGSVILILGVTISAHHDGDRSKLDDVKLPNTGGDDLVVDTNRMIVMIVLLGILGVIVLGVIAWFVARQAVKPLAQALRLQRNFVADASHELRTPLTVLSTRIQLLQRRQQRGDPIEDVVADLRGDVEAMNDVLTDLLVSAEDAATHTSEASDLVAAAIQVAEHLRPLSENAHISLSVTTDAHPMVAIPSATLGRCLTAVVDNAIQHSPDGAAVTVHIARTGDRAETRVTNTGGHISPVDESRIFERFQHGAETGRRRSFGLGLALVRDIVNRYGGSISVDGSAPADRTTFVIAFPIAK